MLNDVWVTVAGMFTEILNLFTRLFSSFGITNYLLGGFFIWTAYRFLLKPILGGQTGSSDKVKKGRSSSSTGGDE